MDKNFQWAPAVRNADRFCRGFLVATQLPWPLMLALLMLKRRGKDRLGRGNN